MSEKGRRQDEISLELQEIVSHMMWVLGTELQSLKEQHILSITKPFLQPICIQSKY